MVREIKFRAKLKENSQFWHYGSSEVSCGIQLDENASPFLLPISHFWNLVQKGILDPESVEEYTSRKDENGIEIYEGDRVKNDNGSESEVEWDNIMTGYHPFHRELQPYIRKWEIIGNIRENP